MLPCCICTAPCLYDFWHCHPYIVQHFNENVFTLVYTYFSLSPLAGCLEGTARVERQRDGKVATRHEVYAYLGLSRLHSD